MSSTAPTLTHSASAIAETPSRPVTLDAAYREHFKSVWRVLRRVGVPAAQIEDATQDVFLVVHRKLDDFDARAPLRSWILAIAVRVASEYRRRALRGAAHELSEAIADLAPTPAEHSETRESIRLLHAVLEQLDDEKRSVFVLSELEQLSAPEIAAVLGLNLNTVYSRLRASRKQFEAALARRRASRASRSGSPWAILLPPAMCSGGDARWSSRAGWSSKASRELSALGSKLNLIIACAAAAVGTADTAADAARAAAAVDLAGTLTAPVPPAPIEITPSHDAPVPAPPQDALASPPKRAAPPQQRRGSARARERSPSSTLSAELALLQRVQSALRRGDAARALDALDAHQTHDLALLAERRAARVIALCMLQRAEAAESAARDFALQHPDSVQHRAIASACANLRRNGAR